MVRHTAKISKEQSDYVPKPIPNISALPSDSVREAASLLELAQTCTSCGPELTGLYYDQLTSIFMTKNNFDRYFMSWLYETIHDGFKATYVIDNISTNVNDIELKMQYTINR